MDRKKEVHNFGIPPLWILPLPQICGEIRPASRALAFHFEYRWGSSKFSTEIYFLIYRSKLTPTFILREIRAQLNYWRNQIVRDWIGKK